MLISNIPMTTLGKSCSKALEKREANVAGQGSQFLLRRGDIKIRYLYTTGWQHIVFDQRMHR